MMQALRRLGQQARWALPMGVFLGILWPDLAQAARPLLNVAVVGTLTAALLRMAALALSAAGLCAGANFAPV
jgi:hypothetical protein